MPEYRRVKGFNLAHAAERLSDALAFAIAAHGTQVRKGTTIPYVSHLLQVAGLVLEHGGDGDTIDACA